MVVRLSFVRVCLFSCATRHKMGSLREKREKEQEEEGEKVRYWRRASEQDGGSSECSVILFVYVYECSLSLVLQLF